MKPLIQSTIASCSERVVSRAMVTNGRSMRSRSFQAGLAIDGGPTEFPGCRRQNFRWREPKGHSRAAQRLSDLPNLAVPSSWRLPTQFATLGPPENYDVRHSQ